MIKFNNEFISKVPTCCLVEDYQTLVRAMSSLTVHDLQEARENIQTVMDCLAEVIDRYTAVPNGMFMPSGSSAIAMGCESGIITVDGKRDLMCLNGIGLSKILEGGCRQCPETCPHYSVCAPEVLGILLENGRAYALGSDDAEKMVEELNTALA